MRGPKPCRACCSTDSAPRCSFFNAPYFKKRILELLAARPDVECLIVDCGPINSVDSTGAEVLETLVHDLQARGVRLCLADLRTEVRGLLDRAGVIDALGPSAVFPTLEAAVAAITHSQ